MRKSFIDTIVSRQDKSIQGKTKKDKLVDKSSTGRLRPWAQHKKSIYPIAKSYERLGMVDIADKMLQCGQWLKFESCGDQCGYRRLTWANFCRKRLCGMCQWRKSYRVAVDVRKVCHEAYRRYTYRGKLRWILLTLTVRNVRDHKELRDTLTLLSKGWQRMIQRKRVKKAVVGSFRAVEVTINNEKFKKHVKGKRKGQLMRKRNGDLIPNEWYGTYHPHIHALVAVNSSYFKKKDYIKQADWVELWQESCRLDYAPSVDVRPVKDKRNIEWEESLKNELAALGHDEKEQYLQLKRMDGAVAEVSKYATKASDIVASDEEETDRRVWELHTGLKDKRFMSYTGLLRDCWLDLKRQGEVEDAESESADLIHMGEDGEHCSCPACNSELLEEVYGFFSKDGDYYKIRQEHKKVIEAKMEAEKPWKKDKMQQPVNQRDDNAIQESPVVKTEQEVVWEEYLRVEPSFRDQWEMEKFKNSSGLPVWFATQKFDLREKEIKAQKKLEKRQLRELPKQEKRKNEDGGSQLSLDFGEK